MCMYIWIRMNMKVKGKRINKDEGVKKIVVNQFIWRD